MCPRHHWMCIQVVVVLMCVVFTQRCRGSTPCGAVWAFSPTPRVLHWPGARASFHHSCPSCRRHPCKGNTAGGYGLIIGHLGGDGVNRVTPELISLLPKELLERAPEASFLLLPTPLAEGCVVTLVCPALPLCLLPPRLEPGVLVTANIIYSLHQHFCFFHGNTYIDQWMDG